MITFLSVIFVGHIGPAELAAASLGSSLLNILGLAVMAGLAGAITTLSGQAYGAKKYALVGFVWQRAIIILGLLCVPVSVLLFFAKPLLLATGQTPTVAAMTSTYIRWALPGVWGFAAYITATNYLQAQKIVRPQVVTSAIVLAIHAPMNLLFIYTFDLGYLGAALATAVSFWLQFLTLLVYILFLKGGEPTWSGWSRECLRDWWPFFKIAVPSMLLISEWWANAKQQLSAVAIYQTTNAMCFTLSLGISMAVSTRVSNELGASRPRFASHASSVSLCLDVVCTLGVGALIFLFRHQWGLLFSNDAQLSHLIAEILVILSGYVIVDGLSVVLGGVVKGVGKQALATPFVFFSYYAVGLPLAALFGFHLKWGVKGLCLGMLLGTAVHATCFFFLVWRLDWNLEAQKAAARVGISKRASETMEHLISHDQNKEQGDFEEDERMVESTGRLVSENLIEVEGGQHQDEASAGKLYGNGLSTSECSTATGAASGGARRPWKSGAPRPCSLRPRTWSVEFAFLSKIKGVAVLLPDSEAKVMLNREFKWMGALTFIFKYTCQPIRLRLDWNSEAQKAAARVGIPKRASKIMKHLISDDEDIEQGGFEEDERTAYWQTDFTEFGRSRGQPTSRN
ncbi:hypothetical protein WJX82_001888 [Trebouxia sp. C0006]